MVGRPKVALTGQRLQTVGIEAKMIGEAGAELVVRPCRTEEELVELGRDADALMIGRDRITRRVVGGLDRCRIIVRRGIGVENIDVAAATERRIYVSNVPDYCIEEVADHTIALVLACARKVVWADRLIRDGLWALENLGPIRRLRGQVLGIVGFGRIGRGVATRGIAFGFRVLAYDPFLPPAAVAEAGAEPTSLDSLLAQADFVSLHTPLTPETQHILDRQALQKMKASAYLINAARGDLVDQDALVDALRGGRIAGAALDVFSREPLPSDDPLLTIPNVVVTPHIAFLSEEAVAELHRKAAEEVVRVLRGEEPLWAVNARAINTSE